MPIYSGGGAQTKAVGTGTVFNRSDGAVFRVDGIMR